MRIAGWVLGVGCWVLSVGQGEMGKMGKVGRMGRMGKVYLTFFLNTQHPALPVSQFL
jgi:hypothetical protein